LAAETCNFLNKLIVFSLSAAPLRKRDAHLPAVETAHLPHTHHHRGLLQDLRFLELSS
jgi:hypothetical protein